MTLYGGGYEQGENSARGALTVTARVSNGSSRHAMPSVAVSDFIYAALLYKDGASSENPESKTFVKGEIADDGKLTFSFQRPEDTSGTFTLEIFAFVKTEGGETPQFSKETALLSGNKTGLKINGDAIEVKEAIALAISSDKPGTVSLKIKVPADCSLEINGTTNFNCEKDEASSDIYVLTQVGDGISAGAYQVNFTVRKDGENGEIVHIFSEYINVINGLCTDTWSGSEKGEAKDVTNGISKAVYVRGAGGWYETSPYKDTATASDGNSGSLLSPLATIQKAVDTVIARNAADLESNDGEPVEPYTIFVDGTLKCDENTYIGENGMADFSKLAQNLTLTIKALSGTATLDGGAVFNEDGTVETKGIDKRIIYAKTDTNGKLDLTLEKLVITGGSNGGVFVYGNNEFTMNECEVSRCTCVGAGGGVSFGGGTFTMESGTISGNASTGAYGGGVYFGGGTFIMKGGTIFGNTAIALAGGVYLYRGTFKMEGGEIKENKAGDGGGVYAFSGTFTMSGGEISGNTASEYCGGVYVYSGTFTMSDGTISNCTAGSGGGVFVKSNGTFEMSGTAKIAGCTATSTDSSAGGGGIYSLGTFNLKGGTIGGTTSAEANKAVKGGGVYVNGGTFTMEGGKISRNKATTDGYTTTKGGGVCVGVSGKFEMSSGTISENTAGIFGGGVYVSGGLSLGGDGAISNNTATFGGGVYVDTGSTFTMGGSASIPAGDDGKNDVYLYVNGTNIATITVAGALTAATPVATIKPAAYTENRPLLSASDGVTLSGSICDKFAVKPQSDGTEWRCALDGADGVLIRKYALGDTGPGGGAVCYYSADGFIVNGKTCHYLECSKDHVGTTSWCPCTSSGGYCELTLSTDVGAGYANTQAILAHPNHASVTASNCAAKACAEYSTSTTTAGEWFLPSHNEATKINRGIVITNDENLWVSGNPLISSESDNSKAGSLYVESNGFSGGNKAKNIYLSVRAMRAF